VTGRTTWGIWTDPAEGLPKIMLLINLVNIVVGSASNHQIASIDLPRADSAADGDLNGHRAIEAGRPRSDTGHPGR
jgi:hypothetical protein